MKLKITLGLFLATFLLSAQSVRMNRDIEVAEKILETLLEEVDGPTMVEEEVYVIGNKANVEGTYIEGFGAMFSITSGHSSLNSFVFSTKKKDKDKSGKAGKVTIIRPSRNKIHYDLEDLEVNKAEIQNNFKSVVETFVCDYGYLMRQLGDNEKIMIRYGMNSFSTFSWSERFSDFDNFNGVIALGDQNKQKINYSATVSKADINGFQNNRINESQLKESIKFVFEEAKEQKEKYKDLDLLASILSKIHKNDAGEEDLYLRGTSNYEKIDGLGAIYKLNVRARGHHSYFGLSTFPEIKWSDNYQFFFDKSEEQNKYKAAKDRARIAAEKAKALEEKARILAEKARETENRAKIDLDKSYTNFIEAFKNNIIDYGSIVKSLESGEALIFKLKFPKCEDCKKMPERLEITVKKSTLAAYRKDQISLESAVSQLIVK